jgi:hypothetical protein
MADFGSRNMGFFGGSSSGGGGGVSSVGATAPLTSTGGSTPDISTNIATNKLVGRYSASSGVMQEVTIGDGLNLTAGGQLNNTATPTPLGYYGSFYDTTTQTATLTATAYPVQFNTTDIANGISIANNGLGNPTRITIANTGVYDIEFSLQLEKTGGSGNFVTDIWLRKNENDIPYTTGKVVLTGSANASPIVPAWNFVVDAVAGDYYELMWAVSNNNVIILSAVATPPHPAIPSSILTVTQQSGIMAGTGITAINSLTSSAQTMATGTSGTDFAISSSGSTHTFNLPTASVTNRGALSTTDWTRFANFQILTGYQTLGSTFKSILMSNPSISNITQSISLTTQQFRGVAVYIPIAQIITGVKWFQTVQGAFTNTGYNGVALYTYSGGTITRVALSTDSEATWETATANSWGNVAFSTPYSASEGLYFIGLLYCGGATAPAIGGTVNSNNANVNIGDFTNSSELSFTLNLQTTTPSSLSLGGAGVTVSGNNPAVYLY